MSSRSLTAALRAGSVLLLLAYLAAGAWLVLTRDGWAVNRLNVAIWVRTVGDGGLRTGMTPEQFADLANVLLFIPLFLALALLRPSWWWVLMGTALSSAIEVAQLVRGGRDATVVDVVTNSIGAATGVAIGIAIRRGLRRRERRASQHEELHQSRRGGESCGS